MLTPFITPIVALAITIEPPATSPPASPSHPTAPAATPLLTITLSTEQAPDLAEWADKAKDICHQWWPKILAELPSEGFKPREDLLIEFKKSYNVPAAAAGGRIMVNAEHVRRNPGDLGMMVHELVHIAQAYPAQKESLGWLTEGIADYIRFWKYEPQTKQRQINIEKASYRDAYRTTAAFLAWAFDTYDSKLVTKLNARLRAGKGEAAMFHEFTGRTVDDLWAEFIAAGAPSSPKPQQTDPAKHPSTPHSDTTHTPAPAVPASTHAPAQTSPR
jgi:hypothetical protein